MNKLVSKFFADVVFSVSFFMETEDMTEVEQLPMFDKCFTFCLLNWFNLDDARINVYRIVR